MNAESAIVELIAALELPASARVDQRVSKKLLAENGAPTSADRRAINDGVDELFWLAALKPNTIGVPDYRDEAREYLEIVVLQLHLRADAKATRLVALTHRAIPYPVLLLTARREGIGVSAAHKRWSQGERDKTVIDGDVVEARLDDGQQTSIIAAFREAIALNRQPRLSLLALYQGWIDALYAYQAARKTGRFVLADTPAAAAARRGALNDSARLEAEISRLRAAAAREKQMARQVALNVELRRIEAELSAYMKNL